MAEVIDYKLLKFSNDFRSMEKDPNWLRAFADYNEKNPDNRLSITCRACYMKVYLWLKS